MLKLNTRDLIDRARQLADMENSSFISWKENFMAMNSAFNMVYQKAIDHNEKFWIKEAVLAAPIVGGDKASYTLPEDFYQLYAINDAKTNRVLLRMSLNEPESSLRYDIVNNQLVIYGNRFAELVVRYFPVPKTLIIPSDDARFEIPNLTGIDPKCIDIYGTILAWTSTKTISSNPIVTVNTFDLVNGVQKEYVIRQALYPSDAFLQATVNSLVAGRNGFILNFTTDAQMQAYLNPKKSYLYSDKLCMKTESIFTAFLTPEKDITIIDDGRFIYCDSLYPYCDAATGAFNFFDSHADIGAVLKGSKIVKYIDKANPNKIAFYNMETGVSEDVYTYYSDVELKYILCKDGIELAVSKGGIISDISGETVYALNGIGVNKIDYDTGYGLSDKVDSDSLVIHSILESTELDYPNNFFYEMLAYQLAIQYKSKQNADCNGLLALYQQAENQFFDTITRDDYQPTRIQNAY